MVGGPVPVGEPLVVVCAAAGVGEAAAVLLPVLCHQRPRRRGRRPCSTAATSTMNGGREGRRRGTESEGLSCNSGGDLVGVGWLIARDDGED